MVRRRQPLVATKTQVLPTGFMKGKVSTPVDLAIGPEWRRMLDACPVAACLARADDGEVVAFNESFRLLAGVPANSAESTENWKLNLWLPGESAEDVRRSVCEAGSRTNLEADFRVKADKPSCRVSASLMVAPGWEGDCVLGFLHSIDEARDVEQVLSEAHDAAVKSARLKSEFLANISHEIRTPLNGIIGMTQLLRDTKLSSLQRNFTETIRLSADNLLHLINEILDFSKLEAGKLTVEHVPFDLQAVVEGTLDVLAERAHSKGLELTYLIHRDVPVRLVGDAARLRQVLTNLIGNAIKFTDQGEVSLEVSAEPGDDGRAALKFEIVDTGIGIPQTAVPHLFQMFHQVDSSTSRRFGGTGLGLAICRQLVEVMDGTIGVASTPGLGSQFWFRLPFERQPGVSGGPVEIPRRLNGLRVLLLETNATNARNLQEVLDRLGVDVDHVTDAQEALATLRSAAREQRPINLAILDVDTPGIDGVTLARAIKAEPAISPTRILLLTTMTYHVDTTLLHSANVGACLIKPLKYSRLPDYLVAALSDGGEVRPASLPRLDEPESFDAFPTLASSAPLRIMIAEDNPINQKVARGLLQRFGHASEVVDSGRKLLRAAELAPYDIIFMDCQLPEMDGLQATRELRRREAGLANGRRTYIVAMTADAVAGARDRCIEAGMDAYLCKPIRLEELHSVLRRALEFVNLYVKRGKQRPPSGVIDPQVMETLRLLRIPGQPDPVPLLIGEFLETAQNRLEEIQGAIMNHDSRTIEYAAHSLRGGAAGIGALLLSELAAELEDGAKHGFMNRTAEMLSQLEDEFQSVRRSLEFERER